MLTVRNKSKACFKGHLLTRKGAAKVSHVCHVCHNLVKLYQLSERKVTMANEIRHIFSSSQLVAVYHYNDLTVSEWDALRTKLDQKSLRMKVIPCKVATKALETTKYKNISLLLQGSSAIAYSKDPCISDLLSVTKQDPKLHLLGGVMEDVLMTPDSMRHCAKLPNKEVVYQQLCSTLSQPQVLLSGMLDSGQMRLSQMLNQLCDKR